MKPAICQKRKGENTTHQRTQRCYTAWFSTCGKLMPLCLISGPEIKLAKTPRVSQKQIFSFSFSVDAENLFTSQAAFLQQFKICVFATFSGNLPTEACFRKKRPGVSTYLKTMVAFCQTVAKQLHACFCRRNDVPSAPGVPFIVGQRLDRNATTTTNWLIFSVDPDHHCSNLL